MDVITLKSKIPGVDLLKWLNSQNSSHKTYLSLRDHNYAVAGFGNLFDSPKSPFQTLDWTLEDFEDFLDNSNDPEMRLFVACPFDLKNDKFKFILPRFEIFRDGNEHFLIFRRWNTETTEEFQKQVILNLQELPEEKWTAHSVKHTPTEPDWDKYFSKAHQELNSHEVSKLVLARVTEIKCSNTINSFSLLSKLNQSSYQCLFQWDSENQWISVSPERLFRLEDSYLLTEAVAGTRIAELEETLLNSEKDKTEHQMVIDDIFEKLKRLNLEPFLKSKMEPYPSNKLVHLKSEIDAELNDPISASDLIRTLHPTAALGGHPSEKAHSWLKANEPFLRDYFGAPFGIMTKDFKEFFVNIRSAKVSDRNILLFAGCGVVENSQAKSEWSELDNKISQYQDLFDAN